MVLQTEDQLRLTHVAGVLHIDATGGIVRNSIHAKQRVHVFPSFRNRRLTTGSVCQLTTIWVEDMTFLNWTHLISDEKLATKASEIIVTDVDSCVAFHLRAYHHPCLPGASPQRIIQRIQNLFRIQNAFTYSMEDFVKYDYFFESSVFKDSSPLLRLLFPRFPISQLNLFVLQLLLRHWLPMFGLWNATVLVGTGYQMRKLEVGFRKCLPDSVIHFFL